MFVSQSGPQVLSCSLSSRKVCGYFLVVFEYCFESLDDSREENREP